MTAEPENIRLWAISDLHLASEVNRKALDDIPDHGADWLILAGDVAEREELFVEALTLLGTRFGKLIWVPGNHELWTDQRPGAAARRGDARYRHLVALARAIGVVTPEDPYLRWPGALDGSPVFIAPLFLLYDYSFRPDDVSLDELKNWVREMHAVPVEDLIRIPRVPRFVPWCGTRVTHDWHRRFRATDVVTGHLHTRRTDVIDGTRFHEVSLGYPRQWEQLRGAGSYLRDITPDR